MGCLFVLEGRRVDPVQDINLLVDLSNIAIIYRVYIRLLLFSDEDLAEDGAGCSRSTAVWIVCLKGGCVLLSMLSDCVLTLSVRHSGACLRCHMFTFHTNSL